MTDCSTTSNFKKNNHSKYCTTARLHYFLNFKYFSSSFFKMEAILEKKNLNLS